MYRVITNITFTQQPTASFPDRNKQIIFPLCHEFEVLTTWDSLTDDGTITLPKNIYIKDSTGKRFSLAGTNQNIGGFSSTTPFFLRGDKIVIKWGYAYYDKRGNEVAPIQTVFEGYISEVTSKKPFVLKVEDNMFKLKQVQAFGGNNGFFSAKKYTVEKMVAEMMKNSGLPFTVDTTTSTGLGDFTTKNETIAEVLARLRHEFHFEAYFKGDVLRVGSFVYQPKDALTKPDGTTRTVFSTFQFQQNIISDSLDYRRKDDITLSAVATNTIETTTGKYTKDGQAKTKKSRLEVLVTFRYGSDQYDTVIGYKDAPLPPNEGGERRTLHFLGATTTTELARLAANELRKYYYTGFKGKFVTFGAPYVQGGDYINLIDPILPERNGRYIVKSVKYTGGVNGLRQEIELDYLLFTIDSKGNQI
jgi:hypothetical protein